MQQNVYERIFGKVFSYPVYSEQDLVQFDEDSKRVNNRLVSGVAKGVLFFALIFWPTDFMIYGTSGVYIKALFIWRIVTSLCCISVIVLLRYSKYFRRYPEYIFIVCVCVMVFVSGYAVTSVGTLNNMFFYGIYSVPFLTVIIIISLPVRTLLALMIPIAFYLGVGLRSYEFYLNPFIWTPVIWSICNGLGAVIMGHGVYHLIRVTFLQRLQISRVNDILEDKVDKRTAELSTANLELKKLASDMTDIQEKERTRISHDLHDELGQLISGLSMQVFGIVDSAGVGETINNAIKKIDDIIRQIQKSLRHIIMGLHPVGLEREGLVPMINLSLDEFQQRCGINITKLIEIESENDLLIGNREKTAIFRIVQEALTNIERHAGAQNVDLKLTAENGVIKFTISDDGEGFDVGCGDAGNGIGLFSMQERTRMFGGQYSIDSAVGQGTRIDVLIPIIADRPESQGE